MFNVSALLLDDALKMCCYRSGLFHQSFPDIFNSSCIDYASVHFVMTLAILAKLKILVYYYYYY